MSFGKSKSRQSQQSSSQTTVSPWSQQQYDTQTKGMMDAVGKYTSQPFNPYTGQMVAGLGQGEQAARDMAQAGSGAGGLLDQASGAVTGAMGYNGTDVSAYYNPYEQDVVNAAGSYFDQNLSSQLSQNSARATQSGAFGGSRHGVADAELMRTSNMDRAGLMADLKYKGYNDARQAGFQNQQAQYQGAGLLGNIAGQKTSDWQTQASMLNQMGATDREIEQARLLAQRSEFDRAAKDQYDKLMLELQTRQGILGATPFTTNTNATGSTSGSTTNVGLTFPSLDKFGIGVPGG